MPTAILRLSGVVPYRLGRDGPPELLLVTSSGGARWIVPKGHIEPGLTPRASAVKEAFEEAGAIGIVGDRPIARVHDRKAGAPCIVDLYAMEVAMTAEDWPERGRRRRRWVSAEEAAVLVRLGGFERCVARLLEHLGGCRRRRAAAA
jgi:8-oxo-dGTP pyrophosphatase MutT (NUDIX family)